MMTNQPAPVAPTSKVERFHKFGNSVVCDLCDLDVRYCKGHTQTEWAAGEGADSNLVKRIAEARAGR